MTVAVLDLTVARPQVVTVTSSSPALLIEHLQALGAKVTVPLLDATTVRDGRAYVQVQASVDLPAVDGVSLHLVVSSEPVIIAAAEHRARVAARRGGGGRPS